MEPDAGSSSGDGITLDAILQEKKTFDLSLNFEKLGVDDQNHGWSSPAPSEPVIIESMPTRSNILSTGLLKCQLPSTEPKTYLAATTADRRLHLFDPETPSHPLVRSYSSFVDSPILDVIVVEGKYLLTGSMSGRLLLYDTKTDQVLDERRDQTKYIVKLAVQSSDESTIIASAGWDSKVFLYRLSKDESSRPCLGNPIASLTLSTVPETLLFVKSPETLRPILLLSRRDSSFLYYYSVPLHESTDQTELRLLGRQNLAPHSNAWVAFTPSDVQLSPKDQTLVAVATSSTPHMKLLLVRLLIPPEERPVADRDGPVTQASQARDALLIQDKEEGAIVVNVNTMAPQTTYSTPRLIWRPDGSGVYVSSDDGVVRGFEANTGKQITILHAHEPGSKIRCLWAGKMDNVSGSAQPSSEILLTGGFDQKLIVWRIP